MSRIYLDHVSTTPLDPAVRRAMEPFLGLSFGNASSPNRRGREAREVLDGARRSTAAILGAGPDQEIIFTASATEANNLAIRGIALAPPRRPRSIAVAATEHISILHPLRSLERDGIETVVVPVDGHGGVRLDRLAKIVERRPALLSVAHASAEIGTLQPIAEICRLSHLNGVPVHVDATATIGLVPLPEGPDRPDLVTLAPHLFYGPQGIGALSRRRDLRLAPLVEGGGQEGGLRAGTEALAAAAGFGAAADLAGRERSRRAARAAELAARMRRMLVERIPEMTLTGHPDARLPGLVTLCVRGIEAEALLQALDLEGIDAASGSPCTTEVRTVSHVLAAIRVDPLLARGALSLSFGEANADGDPEIVGDLLPRIVGRLRELRPPGIG